MNPGKNLAVATLVLSLGACGSPLTNGPCEGRTCGGHGRCGVVDGTTACRCDPGYHPDGLGCVPDSDPCRGVACSGRGTCDAGGESPVCVCEQGFHSTGLDCEPDAVSCDGVTCSGHGFCLQNEDGPLCECEYGFQADGLDCVAEACIGVDCSGHGVCEAESGWPACVCEAGFRPEGLSCVEIPSICIGVSCPQDGHCVDDGGRPVCRCDNGFIPHQEKECARALDERVCTPDGWCWQSPDFPTYSLDLILRPAADQFWFVGEWGFTVRWDGTGFSLPDSSSWNPGVRGMWAGSTDDVWAVGYEGLFMHWDGSGWSQIQSGTNMSLTAVWASGPSDVWAVGSDWVTDSDWSGHYEHVVLHWNGEEIATVQEGPDALNFVWGFAPDDVWLAGGAIIHGEWDAVGTGLLLHWDGKSMNRIAAVPDVALSGLWGAAPDDLWACGGRWVQDTQFEGHAEGVLLHWEGETWSEAFTVPGGSLSRLSGSSARDIWALGFELLYHWDGFSWTEAPAPERPGEISAIRAISDSEAWASGHVGRVLHWDGSSWNDVGLRWSPRPEVYSLWGTSWDNLWGVGYRLEAPNGMQGVIAHWDGVSWLFRDHGGRSFLGGLWGAASDDIWAAGYQQDMNGPVLLHWDGKSWDEVQTPSEHGLQGIWGADSSHVWAAGLFYNHQSGLGIFESGAVIRWDGASWSVEWTDPAAWLGGGVFGTSADDVWAFGSNTGTGKVALVHRSQDGWSFEPSEIDGVVWSMWGCAADDVWAVGGKSTGVPNELLPLAMHWDGAVWSAESIAAPGDLHRVWGTGCDDVWTAGDGNQVFHFDGLTWAPEYVGAGEVYGLFSIEGTDAWATTGGAILHKRSNQVP
ncbi:MAG: hypothetical protein HY897_03495 [Deltaproteobacteria bacterium]|nr:hypothetical protein [Deltaproteobacteria bacterium]